jgi:hypothetical protein
MTNKQTWKASDILQEMVNKLKADPSTITANDLLRCQNALNAIAVSKGYKGAWDQDIFHDLKEEDR